MKNKSVVLVLALAGCPDDSSTVLWLVPNGSELAVKLTTTQPTKTY